MGKRQSPDELEFYETPAWCVEILGLPRSTLACDPFAGNGAILRHFDRFIGCEIEASRAKALYSMACRSGNGANVMNCDSMEMLGRIASMCERKKMMIVTNPPFSLAAKFVLEMERESRKIGSQFTGYLLQRLDWVGAKERALLFDALAPNIHILPRRPSFTADGATDMRTYAWFEFGPNACGKYTLLFEGEK